MIKKLIVHECTPDQIEAIQKSGITNAKVPCRPTEAIWVEEWVPGVINEFSKMGAKGESLATALRLYEKM